MPTRSLPVESRSRRRPSGAGFRRTATQMALSRCAIAHRGADWYFWRGTPAIACVAAQPPCSWHLPEAGQATGEPCPALEAKWLHRHPEHPVTTTAIRHAQVPAFVLDGRRSMSPGTRRRPDPGVLGRRLRCELVTVVLPPEVCSRPAGQRAPRQGGVPSPPAGWCRGT